MDGILMNALHGNLHRLSEKSLRKLVNYYITGTLSLQDHYLLLNEIIVTFEVGRLALRMLAGTFATQSFAKRR